jgi:hypothetical protein
MITTLLTSKPRKAQSGTREPPSAHFLLGNEGIPKHQPQNESMFRDSQCIPNNLMPYYLLRSGSNLLPSLRTRIIPSRGLPNRSVISSNLNFRYSFAFHFVFSVDQFPNRHLPLEKPIFIWPKNKFRLVC